MELMMSPLVQLQCPADKAEYQWRGLIYQHADNEANEMTHGSLVLSSELQRQIGATRQCPSRSLAE